MPDRPPTGLVQTHHLDAVELEAFERDGYVIRHDVFTPAEVARMVDHSETLVADLVRDRTGTRLEVGSYVFDPDLLRGVIIKWEGDTDAVHGIEPFAHLCDLDPRALLYSYQPAGRPTILDGLRRLAETGHMGLPAATSPEGSSR